MWQLTRCFSAVAELLVYALLSFPADISEDFCDDFIDS